MSHNNKKIAQFQITEEMFKELFTHATDIMAINGLDGYFRLVNPAFETMLGYTAEEIKSKHFLQFIHPNDLPATQEAMKKRIKGEYTYHFENRYRRKDGTYVWIEWTSFPVTEHGEMYAVGHNITERRQAEIDKLKMQREMLDRVYAEKQIELTDRFLFRASQKMEGPLKELEQCIRVMNEKLKTGTLAKLPSTEGLEILTKLREQLNLFSNVSTDLIKSVLT